MLNQDDRKKALLYEEWSVSLSRLFAVKFRLRKERSARMKRTKKREPHIGNKRPIFVDHVTYQERCLDRLMDSLGLSRRDVRGLDSLLNQRPRPEWIERGVESADRRVREDKQAGTCGCHLCAARQHDRQWLQGR